MCISEKTVEAYVARIFTKLDLPGTGDTNRRVLAVLTWLRTHHSGVHPRPSFLAPPKLPLSASLPSLTGNGKMIDALRTGKPVEQDSVSVMSDLLGYWSL